jgi:DNA-binding response OmpR family regulator
LGRVLIVDDDRTLAAMIEEELEKAGFDCVRAATDRAAQRALERGRPFDGMVTDVNLGEGVTGFDLGRFARQRHPHIRIVYMSGEANAQHWMAFGVPASDYLSKPFALEKLCALLLQGLAPEQRRAGDDQTAPRPVGNGAH